VGSQFNSTASLHLLVDFFSPQVWQGNVIKDMKEILCAKEENQGRKLRLAGEGQRQVGAQDA
jgi:hypothetical protein